MGQGGQGVQQAGPVAARFAHRHDAAAAGVQARRMDVGQGIQPVLIGAGADHLAVIFRPGVEVVVIIVEAGFLQRHRLVRLEHAERDAGLPAHGFVAGDHG